jgi:hypothetical protein
VLLPPEHIPDPLHVVYVVWVSLEHVVAAHVVEFDGYTHAEPSAAQAPVSPHVVPLALHAEAQQMPMTQWRPAPHALLSEEQSPPAASLATHMLLLHQFPSAQSASTVQLVQHALPLQA